MASKLNEISEILTGDPDKTVKPSAQPGTAAMASSGNPLGQAHGLSQLSDAAEKIEVKVVHTVPAPAMPASATQLSQETLIDAAQQMQFQQPSQPDIPPPILPESQNQSQQVHIIEDGKHSLATAQMALNDPNLLSSLNLMHSGFNMEQITSMQFPFMSSLGSPEDDMPSLGGGNRSKGKKQTRRGPMDEMRQLIRILIKIFPHSIGLIGNTDEAGGGNRISEEQIKSYLEKAVGNEAPRPIWGVPNGWFGYLGELFSWATGKVVTGEEAKRVAKREPGRSWEALEEELHMLGVHPACWPLPLTLRGIQEAEKDPTPLPLPVILKRHGIDGTPVTTGKRARPTSEKDFNKLDEADLWKAINDALNVAMVKSGTGNDQGAVQTHKTTAKSKMDDLCMNLGNHLAGLNMFNSYIPVMASLDGNTNLFNMMQGLPMDDPNTAAMMAAAMGANIDGLVNGAATGSGVGAASATAVPYNSEEGGAKRQKREGEEEGKNENAGAAANTNTNNNNNNAQNIDSGRVNSANRDEDTEAKAGKAAAAAAGAQLGTLPMQPPPLNVNFNAALPNAMQPYLLSGFNLNTLGLNAGAAENEVAAAIAAAAAAAAAGVNSEGVAKTE